MIPRSIYKTSQEGENMAIREIGHIGMEIAEAVLKENYRHIDDSVADSVLESGNYDMINELIRLDVMVDATVDRLNLALAQRRKPPLPEGFKQSILLYDAHCDIKNADYRKRQGIDPKIQGDIAVEVADYLQESWARENDALFFLPENESEMYRHLPSGMIGWKAMQPFFVYIRPIMVAAGMDGVRRRIFHSKKELTAEGDYVHEAYKRWQQSLKRQLSVTSAESFYRSLAQLDLHGFTVTSRVANALRADDHTRFLVAAQVMRADPKGPFNFSGGSRNQ